MASHSPTYLPATVQNVAGKRNVIVTAVSDASALVLVDPPLPARSAVVLRVVPEPGAQPVEARGHVTDVRLEETTAGASGPFSQGFVGVEIAFDEPSQAVKDLIRREVAAAQRGQRIAIVDDDLLQLRLLQRIMLKLGYDPICISTGIGAAHVIAEAAPRLVMLDINMPNVDGPEVCRNLKDNPRTKDIPVIFISGLPRDEIEKVASEAGAVGWLEKGADVNAIIEELHSHL